MPSTRRSRRHPKPATSGSTGHKGGRPPRRRPWHFQPGNTLRNRHAGDKEPDADSKQEPDMSGDSAQCSQVVNLQGAGDLDKCKQVPVESKASAQSTQNKKQSQGTGGRRGGQPPKRRPWHFQPGNTAWKGRFQNEEQDSATAQEPDVPNEACQEPPLVKHAEGRGRGGRPPKRRPWHFQPGNTAWKGRSRNEEQNVDAAEDLDLSSNGSQHAPDVTDLQGRKRKKQETTVDTAAEDKDQEVTLTSNICDKSVPDQFSPTTRLRSHRSNPVSVTSVTQLRSPPFCPVVPSTHSSGGHKRAERSEQKNKVPSSRTVSSGPEKKKNISVGDCFVDCSKDTREVTVNDSSLSGSKRRNSCSTDKVSIRDCFVHCSRLSDKTDSISTKDCVVDCSKPRDLTNKMSVKDCFVECGRVKDATQNVAVKLVNDHFVDCSKASDPAENVSVKDCSVRCQRLGNLAGSISVNLPEEPIDSVAVKDCFANPSRLENTTKSVTLKDCFVDCSLYCFLDLYKLKDLFNQAMRGHTDFTGRHHLPAFSYDELRQVGTLHKIRLKCNLCNFKTQLTDV